MPLPEDGLLCNICISFPPAHIFTLDPASRVALLQRFLNEPPS